MVSKPYDPALKALVETEPSAWPVFLGRRRAPTTVIDADIATVSGAGDKVLRVRDDPPYLLHLEFVAGHDAAALPRKLNVRNVLLEDRHDMAVRSAAVFLRPEADSPRLTGERRRGLSGEEPYNIFRYDVVRVWQLPVGPLLAGGIGTLPLAPISAVTESDLPGIIEHMRARLSARAARRRASNVWAATFIMMGLRYSPTLAAHLLQGVLSMEESATYQWIIAQGALAEAKKLVRLQAESRFGPLGPRLAAALDAITDVQRLEELGVRLMSAANWEELLGESQPAPRRRSPRRHP